MYFGCYIYEWRAAGDASFAPQANLVLEIEIRIILEKKHFVFCGEALLMSWNQISVLGHF